MNPISRIAPLTDAQAARMARPGTLADLADRLTSMPAEAAADAEDAAGLTTWQSPRRRRRRLLIAIPALAALAVAALLVSWLGGPGQRIGPVGVGLARAQALSFTRHGGYIDVIIRNPLADPGRYRIEFARHHMNITLKLVPVPPPDVGTLIVGYTGGGITTITARGCDRGGDCPQLGLRIPVSFHGPATFEFGRKARPGEHYMIGAPATAPGEPMHGMHYLCRTLPAVLGMLGDQHVTVAVIRYATPSGGKLVFSGKAAPGMWFVNEATMWAPRQVMLWVGPSCTPGLPGGTATPGPGQSSAPSPSPVQSSAPSPSPAT